MVKSLNFVGVEFYCRYLRWRVVWLEWCFRKVFLMFVFRRFRMGRLN